MSVNNGGAISKGYMVDESTGEIKKFLFNPTKHSDSQKINYKITNSPGSNYPVISYSNTSERTINFSLTLLAKTYQEIEDWINWINKRVNIGRFQVPPIFRFSIGTYHHRGVISNINRDYEDYDQQMNLRQVTLTISMIEV